MNSHRATALLAAASLLALAGCGSSSSSGAKSTASATSGTTSAATSTTPATSAPAPAATTPAASSAPAPASSTAPVASVKPSSVAAPQEPSAKVTISVDCEPPKTQAAPRADWEADVKTFEAAHPLITIKSVDTNPCVNPATFNANLKAGKVADVFYVYNTDAQDVINKGQALNIQKYADSIPGLSDIIPAVKAIFQKGGTPDGELYGLPHRNYTLGLVYNRELFTKAGLDPNTPPATWADVVKDAKAISALGNGTIGYADYSAGNTGGWHFTGEMYSQGGDITADGKTADFNNDKGMAVLNNLHQMRWVDNSMGTKQLLQYDDLNQMMASGKLGMHIGAPDQVQRDHDNFKADYTKYGMGPMPGGASTLLGGDGYVFNTKDSEDQVKAGLLWLEYENLTPGNGQFNYARASKEKQAVGLPEPAIWTGAFAAADEAAKDKFRTIPAANFAPYVKGTPLLKGNAEPPNAQAIYADLDKVMSEVLTNKNADIAGLLKSHADAVSKLLVAVPKA